MPRQSRSGGGSRAPSRPTVPAKRPVAPSQSQTRPSSTVAQPPSAAAAAPPQASAGSGLFGQMASTAAGVAIGSSIGNAIGGLFGSAASSPAPEAPQNNSVAAQGSRDQTNNWAARSCDVDAKQFTKCMDDNQGNLQVCNWYLEQLKACQQAASQY